MTGRVEPGPQRHVGHRDERRAEHARARARRRRPRGRSSGAAGAVDRRRRRASEPRRAVGSEPRWVASAHSVVTEGPRLKSRRKAAGVEVSEVVERADRPVVGRLRSAVLLGLLLTGLGVASAARDRRARARAGGAVRPGAGMTARAQRPKRPRRPLAPSGSVASTAPAGHVDGRAGVDGGLRRVGGGFVGRRRGGTGAATSGAAIACRSGMPELDLVVRPEGEADLLHPVDPDLLDAVLVAEALDEAGPPRRWRRPARGRTCRPRCCRSP